MMYYLKDVNYFSHLLISRGVNGEKSVPARDDTHVSNSDCNLYHFYTGNVSLRHDSCGRFLKTVQEPVDEVVSMYSLLTHSIWVFHCSVFWTEQGSV